MHIHTAGDSCPGRCACPLGAHRLIGRHGYRFPLRDIDDSTLRIRDPSYVLPTLQTWKTRHVE